MNQDQNIALANPCFVSQEHEKQKAINDIENISFVCGGAMMIRIKIFQKIGFFDNNLFLYGEDDEISGRVIEDGYKSILVKVIPNISVYFFKFRYIIWKKFQINLQ